MSEPILLHAADIAPQAWRNGGGLTRELLLRPAGTAAWRLRISLAEVAREGAFSSFPGVQRWFSVIDGAGVRLSLDGRDHLLRPGHEPLCFSGEVPAFCSLLGGPTVELNLMHVGGEATMERVLPGAPWSSPLPQRGLFTRAAGLWCAPGAPRLQLPPRCLLWFDQADRAAWTFLADSPAVPAPALWLAFGP